MKSIKNYIILSILILVQYQYGQAQSVPKTAISDDLPDEQIRGEYGVWYKRPGCSTREGVDHSYKITKPFIICEGFDLNGALDLPALYVQSNGAPEDNASHGFLDQLRDDGYDIIILNLLDNTKAISKNSRLVQKLIKDINQTVEANHNTYGTFIYRPMLMGVSMGGLIGRHALCTMEQQGIDHHVEKLITMDTPNQGANIPLGLANLADIILGPVDDFAQFRSILSKFNLPDPLTKLESKLFPKWNGTLSTDAAFEMAINYPKVNPTRTLFLAEMAALGKYPTKSRLVGLSCGANMQKQDGIDAGEYLMDWHKDIFCLIDQNIGLPFGLDDIHVRVCPLTFGARIWAMPGNDLGEITRLNAGSEIGINDNFLSPAISRYNFLNRDFVNAPLTRNWNVDHVSGGFMEMDNFGMGGLKSAIDDADIHWDIDIEFNVCDPLGVLGCTDVTLFQTSIDIDNILGTMNYAPRFTFVPTVSSLDVNSEDWAFNMASLTRYPHNKSMTPFDAIYWNDNNTFHALMDLSGNMGEFEMSEVSPNYLYVQNRTFHSGYQNTFEARKYIVLGKNVDQVPGRSTVGDAVFENGSDVKFSIEGDQFVYFDDGLDIQVGASLDVIHNDLSTCTQKNLSTALSSPNPNWQTLRVASASVSNVSDASLRISTGKEAVRTDTKSISPVRYERSVAVDKDNTAGIFVASVFPTPAHGDTRLRLNLPYESILSINVYNSIGEKIDVLAENQLFADGENVFSVPASSYEKGVYVITIKGADVNQNIKFVVN